MEGHSDTPKPGVTLDLHCAHVAQSQFASLSWHLLSNHLCEIILGSRRGGAGGGRGGAEEGRMRAFLILLIHKHTLHTLTFHW